MSGILRQYEKDGYRITEYTRDGETVSAVIKELIPTEPIEPEPIQPIEPAPIETIEEKLARLERQIEEQSIVQLEVLATIYEELLMKG